MIFDTEKAKEYFLHVYEHHRPEKLKMFHSDKWFWSQCRGDHGVTGHEYDIDMDPNGQCYDYLLAADILGLPVVALEDV